MKIITTTSIKDQSQSTTYICNVIHICKNLSIYEQQGPTKMNQKVFLLQELLRTECKCRLDQLSTVGRMVLFLHVDCIHRDHNETRLEDNQIQKFNQRERGGACIRLDPWSVLVVRMVASVCVCVHLEWSSVVQQCVQGSRSWQLQTLQSIPANPCQAPPCLGLLMHTPPANRFRPNWG